MSVNFLSYSFAQPRIAARMGVNDASYTLAPSIDLVCIIGITSNRTVTLPSVTRIGRHVIIKDESGACSSSIAIVVSGMIDGASSTTITTAYGWIELYFNGLSWSKVAQYGVS